MKPISEKINHSLEERILEKIYKEGITQVIDRIRDQVYYGVQNKIHMEVCVSSYVKVKNKVYN